MARVLFLLHDKKTDGKYSILLYYRCAVGRPYRKLVGETIALRSWSKKTQRAIGSVPGAFELNRYLDELEGNVVEAVRKIRVSGRRITRELIISELTGVKLEFWDYVDKFKESPPPTVGEGTLKVYKRMFDNLRLIQPNLSFSDIGQGTVDAYIRKRRKDRMNDSTIRTELNKLRAFVRHAEKAGVIASAPVLELNISGIDPDEIYLNEDEILRMYKLIGNLSNYPGLDVFARLFVLGTQVGVRVSDLEINPEHIKTTTAGGRALKTAHLKNEKTNSSVVIPLTPLAEEILKHFKWRVPPFKDQDLNDAVKILARLAGIKEQCVWREKIDGEIVETVYEKWQLVSSHTMRRSFATNLYKRGAPSLMIMKITGHKKESSFLKYIRVSKQEAAEEISKYF